MLIERDRHARRQLPRLVAAHADQLVEFAVQVFQDPLVVAGGGDPVVEVDVALALEIGLAVGLGDRRLVAVEQVAQRRDLGLGHQARGEPRRHALERFTRAIDVFHHLDVERHDARTGVRDAHDQAHALEPVNRLAQRAAADAVLLGEVGFDDLGALREPAADNVGLDAVEGARRQGRRFEGVVEVGACDVIGHELSTIPGSIWLDLVKICNFGRILSTMVLTSHRPGRRPAAPKPVLKRTARINFQDKFIQ